jgi:iron complex transport system substrate-binding protein
MKRFPPERIVCLTEETVETLYLLGQEHRIVGVSGYAVRPARVRREKPRVSAFTSTDLPKVMALGPDLVLTFSDLQADIAAALIREGVAVHAFNQRDVAGILAMIGTLAALTGCAAQASELLDSLRDRMDVARARAKTFAVRPKVYFEEWDDPMISSIGWVSELIEIAGGDEVFHDKNRMQGAKDRIVTPAEVMASNPDIVIASWCGKKFAPERFRSRPGFDQLPAVRNGQFHEIKAPLILQPGPAALTDGLDAISAIIARWVTQNAS